MSNLQLVVSNPAPVASIAPPAVLTLAHEAPELTSTDAYYVALQNIALEAFSGFEIYDQIASIARNFAVPHQVVADGVEAQLELLRD